MSGRNLTSRQMAASLALAVAAVASAITGSARAVPVWADGYQNYTPGQDTSSRPNPAVATGLINPDTTFGAPNPFNPPFSTNDIFTVTRGGSVTLHLSSPVPGNGINLGVYSNNGIVDNSTDGSGLAGNPPATFSAFPTAVVSVSQDGSTFVPLNNGQPITFTGVTNYFTDTEISNHFQPTGTQHASQSKPFLGTINNFAGQTYDQIRSTLNGSAGGTWLDLRATKLTAVNYVKFDVPSTTGSRMVIDAVGAMGAANTLTAGGPVISEDVGTGAHASHVVVDFGPQSYDFIVHYDGQITGLQALQELQANSDFRFTTESFGNGEFVTGFDYGGYKDVGDGSTPPDHDDYWSYWGGDGTKWDSLFVGAGSRMLTDGSYDGWVWNAAQTSPPDFAAVPEPSAVALLALGALCVGRRKARGNKCR